MCGGHVRGYTCRVDPTTRPAAGDDEGDDPVVDAGERTGVPAATPPAAGVTDPDAGGDRLRAELRRPPRAVVEGAPDEGSEPDEGVHPSDPRHPDRGARP